MESFKDPNVEELIQSGIQVVLYWDWQKQTDKMSSAGIPVICFVHDQNLPDTNERFNTKVKNEVHSYAEVAESEAEKIADDYAAYYDEKVRQITSVTSKIPTDQRPRVYYVRGPNVLTTNGKNTNMYWYTKMAGGEFVSDSLNQTSQDVPLEQIVSWNPQVIIMGRVNSTDTITRNSQWADIDAVKNKKVFLNPNGVFYWDGDSEGVLEMMWLAKILHPDKFPDLDLNKEVREFYSRFYHYNLTQDQSGRILEALNPE